MRRLPLFPELPLPYVQTVEPSERDANCTLCSLSAGTPAGQRCLPAEGEPGDILVVLASPTEFERRLQRPAASAEGKYVRAMLERLAPGRNVVFTYALGCKAPGGGKPDDLVGPMAACSTYLHQNLLDSGAERVLIFGGMAGIGFLGRSFQPLSVRKGYSWYFSGIGDGFAEDGYEKPVFLLGDPGYALRNKLIAKALEEDVRNALEASPRHAGLHRHYNVVETAEDAVEAWEVLSRAGWIATDCETSGMLHEPDFRIECLAMSDGESTYVWPRGSIEDLNVCLGLAELLENCDHATWNGQYDLVAVECEPSIQALKNTKRRWMLNLQSDSRLKRKLYEADAVAGLETAADLVGMGGHKREAHDQIKEIGTELRKLAMARHLTPTGRKREKPVLKYVREDEVPPVWLEYLDQKFDEEKFAYRFLDEDVNLRYCSRDAFTTALLEDWGNQKLVENPNLALVWDEVVQPSMWAWCCARLTGFPTDRNQLTMLADWLDIEINKLRQKIEAIEPGLNPGSSPQLIVALGKRGIKSPRTTDGGQDSMKKEILETFKGKHPLVDLVLEWKLYTHTQNNFVRGSLPYIRSDGCCHPSYLQDGAETGRASSQDPNFFARLKGRDEASRKLGTMLRECHIMPEGWTLLEIDEGQIEIREVMDLAEDETGIAIITSGMDFHMASARKFAEVLGKDPDKVSDIDREQAKTCIAEGELVLTDRGLVAIENLDENSKVWDGASWVQHDGVVCHGLKRVIHHDGLTATPDHRVYMPDGRCIPLEVAALDGCLAVGGDGEVPVGYAQDDGADRQGREAGRTPSGVPVLPMREGSTDLPVQRDGGQDDQLHLRRHVRGSSHPDAAQPLARDADPVQQPELQGSQELRLSWDRMQVHELRGVCCLGARAPAAPDVPRSGHRQGRQQRALRAWESSARLQAGEQQQQKEYSPDRVQGDQAAGSARLGSHEDGQSELPLRQGVHLETAVSGCECGRAPARCDSGRWAKVYDVVNAGPRHRFTVSGKVVANCNFAAIYELPDQLGFMLSKRIGISSKAGNDLATALFGSYKNLLPWMNQCLKECTERGYSITQWRGQEARHRPLWHLGLPVPNKHDRDKSPDKTRWQNHARSSWNGFCQGSAVDIITSMLWPAQLWMDANTNGGQFILQIYDSIMVMVRDEDAEKTIEFLRALMTDTLPERVGYLKRVPLAVDIKRGRSWGQLEKVAKPKKTEP